MKRGKTGGFMNNPAQCCYEKSNLDNESRLLCWQSGNVARLALTSDIVCTTSTQLWMICI